MSASGSRPSAHWGVGARLTASFVLLGVNLVAIAGIALFVTTHATRAVTELSHRQIPLQRANSEIRVLVSDMRADLRGYVVVGDRASLASFQEHWARFPPAVADARAACGGDPVACRLVDVQYEAVLRWKTEFAAPVAAGDRELGRRPASFVAQRRVLEGFIFANDRLASRLDAEVTVRAADVRADQQIGTALLVGSLVVGVLLALLTGRYAVATLVPPLARLRKVLRRLAAGDLDARAVVEGPAEVRAVTESVNVLAAQSSRLRAEDQARARIRQLARDLDRKMRTHLHAEAVAHEVVNGIGPVLDVDLVHARFAVDGRMGPVAAQWAAPGRPELPVDDGLTTNGWRVWVDLFGASRQPAVLDGQALADLVERHGRSPLTDGVGALLVVPVLAGSDVVGVLAVARCQPEQDWTGSEVSLVESVAADMGRAVHHARLFEQQSTIVGQLRELDLTKSDFLSTISHELRTPLTSIAGYVEMLRDGDAGGLHPMQENMLEVVGRNTQRLRDLIEDVLMISRIESGAVRSDRVPVLLSALTEQAVRTLRPLAADAKVTVDVIPTHDECLVLGDPAQLDRVLLNLIGNAIKFTPAGGRVTVVLEAREDELMLHVEDTGIGVPAAELDSLFTRFFRASNATSRQIPGTGLGLAIVASLVAAHEGRVEVDSVERRGTTFTVVLPRLRQEDVAATRALAARI